MSEWVPNTFSEKEYKDFQILAFKFLMNKATHNAKQMKRDIEERHLGQTSFGCSTEEFVMTVTIRRIKANKKK